MATTDIFYVEDNSDYTEIVERAFNQIDNTTQVTVIEDGVSAINALTNPPQGASNPKLILLDLNLPGLSGLDVLRRIRESQALRYIPVVMFTTSENPADVRRSLDHGANAYVTKPLGYLNLVSCVKALHLFWLKTASAVQ